MVRIAFVRAATSAAAAMAGLCIGGAPAASSEDDGDAANAIYFSGTDIWRSGSFGHGGVIWSPDGLDQEGFTLKILLSGGTYRYTSGALGDAQVIGRQLGAQILPGWRFKRDALEVKVFAGPEIYDHLLFPDDPSASLRGRRAGLKAEIDVWYQPDVATMLTGSGAISTIGGMHHARIAYGWRVFDSFYSGPELATFAIYKYRQYRIGLHVTSLITDIWDLPWEWSAAMGFARDTDGISGAYGRLGLLRRR